MEKCDAKSFAYTPTATSEANEDGDLEVLKMQLEQSCQDSKESTNLNDHVDVNKATQSREDVHDNLDLLFATKDEAQDVI